MREFGSAHLLVLKYSAIRLSEVFFEAVFKFSYGAADIFSVAGGTCQLVDNIVGFQNVGSRLFGERLAQIFVLVGNVNV